MPVNPCLEPCPFCTEDIALQIVIAGVTDTTRANRWVSQTTKEWNEYAGYSNLIGTYQVTLAHDVSGCGYNCTPASVDLGTPITVVQNNDGVFHCNGSVTVVPQPNEALGIAVECVGANYYRLLSDNPFLVDGESGVMYGGWGGDAMIAVPTCDPGCRWNEIPEAVYTSVLWGDFGSSTFTTTLRYVAL